MSKSEILFAIVAVTGTLYFLSQAQNPWSRDARMIDEMDREAAEANRDPVEKMREKFDKLQKEEALEIPENMEQMWKVDAKICNALRSYEAVKDFKDTLAFQSYSFSFKKKHPGKELTLEMIGRTEEFHKLQLDRSMVFAQAVADTLTSVKIGVMRGSPGYPPTCSGNFLELANTAYIALEESGVSAEKRDALKQRLKLAAIEWLWPRTWNALEFNEIPLSNFMPGSKSIRASVQLFGLTGKDLGIKESQLSQIMRKIKD